MLTVEFMEAVFTIKLSLSLSLSLSSQILSRHGDSYNCLSTVKLHIELCACAQASCRECNPMPGADILVCSGTHSIVSSLLYTCMAVQPCT